MTVLLAHRPRPGLHLAGAPAVLVAALLWSTNGTASSFRPATASALSVGAARIVLGGALLLGWVMRRHQLQPVLSAASHRGLLLLGTVAVAAYQVCFFTAVTRTGVAVGTVVAIGSAPVLTGLLARVTRGTPLTARWALSTAVAAAGCAVLVLGGATAGVDPLGIALAVLTGLAYAGYAVVAATLIGADLPSGGVMAALFGGAGLLLLPVLLAPGAGWLLTPRGAAVAGHLAVLTIVVAYLLYGRGLRTVPVATAATLSLAEPGGAALLGLLVLGEPARPTTLTGLGLLGAALLVLTLHRGPGPAPPGSPGSAR